MLNKYKNSLKVVYWAWGIGTGLILIFIVVACVLKYKVLVNKETILLLQLPQIALVAILVVLVIAIVKFWRIKRSHYIKFNKL